ncbi:DotU family type IV/VI secretion system protein [Francisella frigiditurris]|uniref:Type IV / VI secretion system DotU domain-containing protein n=1 Tax=Francisella frigiditurris TaxID=1542390 RepID=A0A1J0KS07_9GAMM|nr:DotU family type IV/VI secretion system protein [Francisella frigiditurris]APC96467.1 hypothetical protein KX01_1297 [Francisella frigiditurris]
MEVKIVDLIRQILRSKKNIRDIEDISNIRKELIESLNQLDSLLYLNFMDERDYIMLAMTSVIDEFYSIETNKKNIYWDRVSLLFINEHSLGEKFYEIIDNVFLNKRMPYFVILTYYMCLSHGFVGKYYSEEKKYMLSVYKDKLLNILNEQYPIETVPITSILLKKNLKKRLFFTGAIICINVCLYMFIFYQLLT